MPELPEAETIVRGLRPFVEGRTIERVRVIHSDILREPVRSFAKKVRKRRVVSVDRRGKNCLLVLDDRCVILVNLGMTGRLLPFRSPPRGSDRPTHPAVRFGLDDGSVLIFDDTRRFGTVEALTARQWSERSNRLGPEPLARGYTSRHLADALRSSRAPIRSWLLDQRRIAGIGNIYANEALFLAGIHPRTPAQDVTGEGARRLHGAIRRVLRDAIRAGGTTIRDYRDATGSEGQYAPRLFVYGRANESCERCSEPIRRIVFGNRSAFHCPSCQPTPPRECAHTT